MSIAPRGISTRQWSLAGLAMCVLMMAVALALQYVAGLEPCPLCIFQRIAVLAAGAVFLVAALHGPRGRGAVVYGLLALAAVAGGIAVAGRHVWLQSLPADQVPSCGPGLDYMLEVLPLWDVLSRVLSGSGECATIDGYWWGLTLPQWTLIGFCVLALIPLGMLVGASRGRRT
ncbi:MULTISPECIES: disulfide bond formation protein B [unclassified Modicisalibacter]|uniref:disulfide bond formation protein B n=1 Tax=unclassified Modicisalibacter TaxID=2679913 RepID=UPI001CCED2CC|nr:MULTISPECIES: disulfide bond formation protein B [unclassified Modicisalibacter]MBZ9557525.1 disulfide bond formation protein B [Modicisalibacter sp. R2A 31.J]MBZ9573810.1 disulfide bond formation protein B [Modicisalibacter sp. MOD 31.J]